MFWHTLWTLLALFGSLTPPKSICTQRHSLQKFLSKKMQILGPAGPTCAFWVQIILGRKFGPGPSNTFDGRHKPIPCPEERKPPRFFKIGTLDDSIKKIFYQFKALSYPLLVTKKFFRSTTPSGENQDFPFRKIQFFKVFSYPSN